jgi:hypothetical protein
MVPDGLHDFFVASAGVAGALIGLLFVAISVSGSRLSDEDEASPIHRIRAAAALTAFMNALTVSLFALIPDEKLPWASVSVAVAGLLFVAASLLSLGRLGMLRSRRRLRDALFLVSLAVVFGFQLVSGLELTAHPKNDGDVGTIAVLVVFCFLVGIYRSWDLIGGPSFGVRREVTEIIHHQMTDVGAGTEQRGRNADDS